MPYGLRKLPDKDLYRVYNKETGEIHSKETTKANALKQIRLLYMIERKKMEGGVVGEKKERCPKGKKRYAPVGDGCYTQAEIDEWQAKRNNMTVEQWRNRKLVIEGEEEEPKKEEPKKEEPKKVTRCPKGSRKYAPLGDGCHSNDLIEEFKNLKKVPAKKEEVVREVLPTETTPLDIDVEPRMPFRQREREGRKFYNYGSWGKYDVNEPKLERLAEKKESKLQGKLKALSLAQQREAERKTEMGIKSLPAELQREVFGFAGVGKVPKGVLVDVLQWLDETKEVFNKFDEGYDANGYYVGGGDMDWSERSELKDNLSGSIYRLKNNLNEYWQKAGYGGDDSWKDEVGDAVDLPTIDLSDFDCFENEDYDEEEEMDDGNYPVLCDDWGEFEEGLKAVQRIMRQIFKLLKRYGYKPEARDAGQFEHKVWEAEREASYLLRKGDEGEGRIRMKELEELSKRVDDLKRGWETEKDKKKRDELKKLYNRVVDKYDEERAKAKGKGLGSACWKGYEAIGMKKKGKRMVPNCVPIKGGVLGMNDEQGNPLPPDQQYKNDRINALNFSFNMLREQLIHLIEVQQNQDAIQEIEDIRDGMGNLSTDMVRLENNREGMPMVDFKREVNRLTAILTRYVREANRWEGEPQPEYGESDIEGFGMCGGRICKGEWTWVPMREELKGHWLS